MKVVVSLLGTRLVVPCGSGETNVRQVASQAATRFNKLMSKEVVVHNLRSKDGAILDPDDRIGDVCDDRELLHALILDPYDENNGALEVLKDIHLTIRRPSVSSSSKLSSPSSTSSAATTVIAAQTRPSIKSSSSSMPDSSAFDAQCSLNVMRRREPLGASNKEERHKATLELPKATSSGTSSSSIRPLTPSSSSSTATLELVLPNEIGPLGIHVVPSGDESRTGELDVQGIEPGGRVDRDGRLAVGDRIVQINGYTLSTVSFDKAQEIFKEALYAQRLKLTVKKGWANKPSESSDREIAMTSNHNTTSTATTTSVLQANNTRKIGTVLKIVLRKGASGLGFSITARDNALGGNTPFYIKNIMSKGAAIEDGQLQQGDRLLEINDQSVEGKSQREVVEMLRNTPLNATVTIVVSRHKSVTNKITNVDSKNESETAVVSVNNDVDNGNDDDNEVTKINSPIMALKEDKTTECLYNGSRSILTFDIPVHDTERAGLGVSVKGRPGVPSGGQNHGVVDYGIFVKSVIYGGAASKDGRLRTNDRLININGVSLLGMPNSQAMETLRNAMHQEGPVPGVISLTVARQVDANANEMGHVRKDSGSTTNSSDDNQAIRQYNVNQPQGGVAPNTGVANVGVSRNPVVKRLMATPAESKMRNESYYMATHDTWLESNKRRTMTPLVIMPTPQDESTSPHKSPNIVHHESSDIYFSRDQPGRQSMSEKRHATLDAKATDTYQRQKRARDERLKLQQQQQKSASVESLHSIVNNEAWDGEVLTPLEREALKNLYVRASSVRVSRSRGCTNESFRAAVDRSYDDADVENQPNEDDQGYEIQDERDESQQMSSKTRSSRGDNRNSKLLRNLGTMFRLNRDPQSNKNKSTAIATNLVPRSSTDSDLRSRSREAGRGDYVRSVVAAVESGSRQKENVMPLSRRRMTMSNVGVASYAAPQLNYMSAMMRPGSRVGITDPSLMTSQPDYEAIQRHLQMQCHPTDHQQGAHRRGQSGLAPPRPSSRPKSNFYDYDLRPMSNDLNQMSNVRETSVASLMQQQRVGAGFPANNFYNNNDPFGQMAWAEPMRPPPPMPRQRGSNF